jgi:hypothetical protein
VLAVAVVFRVPLNAADLLLAADAFAFPGDFLGPE